MRDDHHQTNSEPSDFEGLLRSLAPAQSSTRETQQFFFRLGQQYAESAAAVRANGTANQSEKSGYGRMLAVAATIVLAFGLGTQVNRLRAPQFAADVAGTSSKAKPPANEHPQVSGVPREGDASSSSEPTKKVEPKFVRPAAERQSWLAGQVASLLKSEWNGRRIAIESIGGTRRTSGLANQLVSRHRDDSSFDASEAELLDSGYQAPTTKEQLLRDLGVQVPRRGVLGIY